MHLNVLPTNFALISRKYKNEPFFDILMTITMKVNMQFRVVPPLHYVLVCKTYLHVKLSLLSLLTKISFFNTKFAHFWYMFCFQFETYLAPIPWTTNVVCMLCRIILKIKLLRHFPNALITIKCS